MVFAVWRNAALFACSFLFLSSLVHLIRFNRFISSILKKNSNCIEDFYLRIIMVVGTNFSSEFLFHFPIGLCGLNSVRDNWELQAVKENTIIIRKEERIF